MGETLAMEDFFREVVSWSTLIDEYPSLWETYGKESLEDISFSEYVHLYDEDQKRWVLNLRNLQRRLLLLIDAYHFQEQ